MKEQLKDLCIHVIVGAVAFVVVTIMAVLLSVMVKYLEELGIDPIIIKGLTGLEYFIFGMDLLLVFIFISTTMLKLVKILWK